VQASFVNLQQSRRLFQSEPGYMRKLPRVTKNLIKSNDENSVQMQIMAVFDLLRLTVSTVA